MRSTSTNSAGDAAVDAPVDTPVEHAAHEPGWLLVRLGFGLFVLGVVAIVVAFLPFFFGDRNWPLWLNILCMMAPIGFLFTIAGVVRSGRAAGRRATQG